MAICPFSYSFVHFSIVGCVYKWSFSGLHQIKVRQCEWRKCSCRIRKKGHKYVHRKNLYNFCVQKGTREEKTKDQSANKRFIVGFLSVFVWCTGLCPVWMLVSRLVARTLPFRYELRQYQPYYTSTGLLGTWAILAFYWIYTSSSTSYIPSIY